MQFSSRGALADEEEWRPIGGMDLLVFSGFRYVQHGLAECFGAANFRIGPQFGKGLRDDLYGRIRLDLPVGDKERAGAGHKRTRGPIPISLCPLSTRRRRVAGRQHDPVRIELELGHFRGGQKPVIRLARLWRRS